MAKLEAEGTAPRLAPTREAKSLGGSALADEPVEE